MNDIVEVKKSKRGGKRDGSGRKPGTPNKVTKSVKENIIDVFERLGSGDAMLEWVCADDANKRIFYGTIYPKLLPLQVNGEVKLTGLAEVLSNLGNR